MNAGNSEPLEAVLKQYDLKVLNIKNESFKGKKGVWWIQTDKGYKILKKISNSEETLKFIISAVKHLINNGIKIPEINITADKKDYVLLNDICYVLSDAIEGKNPSYGSPQELAVIARGLAKFHKASQGFFPLPDTKPKYHLGLWIEDYQKQIDDMNRFYEKELEAKERNPVGEVILKEFPGFFNRATEAIEKLKGNEYKEWVEKGKKTGCLCHQDFAAGNLILNNAGDLYVLDTDSITVDLPARDIRKLLNKIMKKSKSWNLKTAKDILDQYNSVFPLDSSELEVIKFDLLFPHLFMGAMNKYCYQRDKEWSMKKYLERIREMAEFEKSFLPVMEKL